MATAATAAAIVLARGQPVFTFALTIAIYTLAVRTDRRTTFVAFGFSALVLTAALVVTLTGRNVHAVLNSAAPVLAWSAVAAALGEATRSRRAYVAAMEERALRAEQRREEEARRRVVEERLWIARELHDVVAHHVAVVSVQAGLAGHLITTRPDAAQRAVQQVRASSAAVLDELTGILTVLRHGDEPSVRAPTPGLADLDHLLGSYIQAGLPVRWSVCGQPRELGDNMGVVAYRVAQEALTNAHKHGVDEARLTVTYESHAVVLEVANRVRRPVATTHADGHGLTGMRERAAAVGGKLQVGPDPKGEFRVRLTLPAPSSAR